MLRSLCSLLQLKDKSQLQVKETSKINQGPNFLRGNCFSRDSVKTPCQCRNKRRKWSTSYTQNITSAILNTIYRTWSQIHNSYKHSTLNLFLKIFTVKLQQGKPGKKNWTKAQPLVLSALRNLHLVIFLCKFLRPTVQRPVFNANERAIFNCLVWIRVTLPHT